MRILNQDLGSDEVRYPKGAKGNYDALQSFRGKPAKTLLPAGMKLYRLIAMATGQYLDELWWIPEAVFEELRRDVNQSRHGGGRLLRNYVAESLALPSGSYQLSVVEISLTQSVYAWVGKSAPLFERPGGMEQVYLPNLTEMYARVVRTDWLKF
ncbi:MAG: hypothetical protein FJW36_07080 [Acidobacteria bacterium]|nr:hypothetical protein [Acidobacteriota bacterium]